MVGAGSQGTSNYEFARSAPLGGSAPAPAVLPTRSHRRELTLGGILLVFALIAGFASLMSWRDYGPFFGSIRESGLGTAQR